MELVSFSTIGIIGIGILVSVLLVGIYYLLGLLWVKVDDDEDNPWKCGIYSIIVLVLVAGVLSGSLWLLYWLGRFILLLFGVQ